jgi:hypothetical protein
MGDSGFAEEHIAAWHEAEQAVRLKQATQPPPKARPDTTEPARINGEEPFAA